MSEKLNDAERLELHELCHALIDGNASEEQRARLGEWLRRSEEARRVYVLATALSASLYEYAGETQAEEPEGVIPLNEQPARSHPAWAWSTLAAAALLVLGLWWGGVLPNWRDHHEQGRNGMAELDPEEVVARVTGARDCQWSGTPAPAGEELRAGQELRLKAGVVEVSFDSGAVVTLEGPGALQVTSEWAAVLRRGTLKAQVPHEAIGFRVSNAEVEVVDLGTEFSMVAEENGGGATEVFVTKGAVETRGVTGKRERMVLREAQAKRFARAGMSEVGDREQKLRKLARMVELERAPRPLGYARWSFDGAAGGTANLGTAEWLGTLAGNAPAAGTWSGLLQATPGRFGVAALFDGTTFGRVSLTGFQSKGSGPRGLAFWARLPADAQLAESAPMLAAVGGEGSPRVELGWNQQPGEGPVGALRAEVGRILLVGSTPLRDGQWHHLALMLRNGRKENKVQPRLYVDGRLESLSLRRNNSSNNAGSAAARRERRAAREEPVLMIGKAPGEDEGAFRGALDEIYLFSRPLTPQEIRSLMQTNRPEAGPVMIGA